MPFGTYKEVMALKAKDAKITGVAQDGGVVTALLCYALDKGIIDGALLAGKSDIPWMPKPVIATTKEEIIACAGTKYTINPVVSVLKDAVREIRPGQGRSSGHPVPDVRSTENEAVPVRREAHPRQDSLNRRHLLYGELLLCRPQDHHRGPLQGTRRLRHQDGDRQGQVLGQGGARTSPSPSRRPTSTSRTAATFAAT